MSQNCQLIHLFSKILDILSRLNLAMSISHLNLPEEYEQKLKYIETSTQQDTEASLLAAIDAYYHHLRQATDPLARLKQSKLIASFDGEPDLSGKSEEIFRNFAEGRE